MRHREAAISAKIFVGNLSFKTTKEELTELVSTVGQPVDVFLPLDRATNKPRGFAFVEFASEEEAKRAIAMLDGKDLGGRALKANSADERPRRTEGPHGGRFSSPAPAMFDPGDGRMSRPKGSRRNVRARKRSL